MGKKHAIILCSGGLDSVVVNHEIKKKGTYKKITILFFDYGQKSLVNERKFSKLCAKDIGAGFKEVGIRELGVISGSLINKAGKVVSVKSLKDTKKESNKWYVPCRNLVFLSYALAFAEASFVKHEKKSDIFVGFKCEGKESYPDTTKEFVNALNEVARKSCSYPFRINAPLIEMDKEDIILLGEKLGVDFRKTFSCYIGEKMHCGKCLNCKLRKAGFYWSGVKDTTSYLSKN